MSPPCSYEKTWSYTIQRRGLLESGGITKLCLHTRMDPFVASQAAGESWKLGATGPTGRHRSWGDEGGSSIYLLFLLIN